MDGLVKLVDAHRWMWTLSSQRKGKPGGRPTYTALSHGGFEDGQFPKLLKAIDHPASWGIFSLFAKEARQRKTHLTWTRRQMDADDHFSRKEVRSVWREAGVGDLMISAHPTKTGELSSIGIYRGQETAEFDGRDARIAHIVLAEVPWLHEIGPSDNDQHGALPKLSPRRRTVLNLVLEGQPRKEMAASLGISTHTLDGYVKDIFRHFGVHSQAELIARFRSGEADGTPGSGD
jgi:DNA-binding CsgD family transcriptional regulator